MHGSQHCVSCRALQGVRTCDPTVLADIRAVTDLCLCIQRSAVQVTGKIMVTMVLQKHAHWLSLADLTEHEKPDMIRLWFQGKKKDKVLQLCFPVAAPP